MDTPSRPPAPLAGIRPPLGPLFGLGALLLVLGGCGEGLFGSGFGGRDFRSGELHTVQPGDTVYGISRATGVPVRTLIDANGLKPPYLLRIGQTLSLSGTPGAQPRGVVSRGQGTPLAADRPGTGSGAGSGTHTVLPGETAFSIARLHGVRVADLARLNGMDDRFTVRAGETLRIPGKPDAAPLPDPPMDRRAPAGTEPEPEPVPVSVSVSTPQPATAPDAPSQGPWATASVSQPGTPPKVSPPREAAPVSAPPERSGAFLWPVSGPVLMGYGQVAPKVHNDGINIGAGRGTPVRASENGVVAYVGNEIRGYGNLVLIKHSNDFMTAYAHLDAWNVARGQTVEKGQDIGKVGSTGGVTRPQLHFEIRKGGKAVDPAPYLGSRGSVSPGRGTASKGRTPPPPR